MDRGPDRFLVWGGGGHGRVVADLVRAAGHELVGYVDSDPSKLDAVVEPGGARVVLSQNEFLEVIARGAYPDGVEAVAMAIGDNATRLHCLGLLGNLSVPPLVHPRAIVSASASIGRGSVVFPRVVVNAGARIGAGAILNTGAIVEHDCLIADGVHLSPGAVLAGGVRIGAASWVGASAVVIQGITVGRDAIVGAGAVVIRDVADAATVVGNPARPLPRRSRS